MDKHTAEIWVKVICILGYIGIGFCFLAGLFLLFGGSFIISLFSAMLPAGANAFVSTMVVVVGIFMIVYAGVALWIYINLWKYKNWARIVIIIFSAFGILNSIFSLPTGIFGLIISGGILYLLAFDKDVKALFGA